MKGDFKSLREVRGETIRGRLESQTFRAVGCEPYMAYKLEDHENGEVYYGTSDSRGNLTARILEEKDGRHLPGMGRRQEKTS